MEALMSAGVDPIDATILGFGALYVVGVVCGAFLGGYLSRDDVFVYALTWPVLVIVRPVVGVLAAFEYLGRFLRRFRR